MRGKRLARRRVAAWLSFAAVFGAAALIVDSLRQSVAQLRAAFGTVTVNGVANVSVAEVGPSAEPTIEPQIAAPRQISSPVERRATEAEVEPQSIEPEDTRTWGPTSAADFAQLLESGVLGDVGADPQAAEDLRRALEAAANDADR